MIGFLIALLCFYPLTTTVTDVADDVVTVEDSTGNIWEFKGADDWEIGDGCSLLMFDNLTDDITDDVIVKTRYWR